MPKYVIELEGKQPFESLEKYQMNAYDNGYDHGYDQGYDQGYMDREDAELVSYGDPQHEEDDLMKAVRYLARYIEKKVLCDGKQADK